MNIKINLLKAPSGKANQGLSPVDFSTYMPVRAQLVINQYIEIIFVRDW